VGWPPAGPHCSIPNTSYHMFSGPQKMLRALILSEATNDPTNRTAPKTATTKIFFKFRFSAAKKILL
jgi:hypothetical protein